MIISFVTLKPFSSIAIIENKFLFSSCSKALRGSIVCGSLVKLLIIMIFAFRITSHLLLNLVIEAFT